MIIEVVNWEKFNPRGKEKKKHHYHWFRVEDQIFSDPNFSDFRPTDWVVFLYVLALTCQKQGKPIKIDVGFCSMQCRIKKRDFQSGLDKLLKLLFVRQTEVVRTPDAKTSSIHYVHNEHNVYTSSVSDDSQVLFEIWNQESGDLPKAKEFSAKRKKAAQARWAEKPDKDYWSGIVRSMAKSPFCLGNGKTGWRATFDFLLQPDTHLKVLEGKYDSKPGNGSVKRYSERLKEGFR